MLVHRGAKRLPMQGLPWELPAGFCLVVVLFGRGWGQGHSGFFCGLSCWRDRFGKIGLAVIRPGLILGSTKVWSRESPPSPQTQLISKWVLSRVTRADGERIPNMLCLTDCASSRLTAQDAFDHRNQISASERLREKLDPIRQLGASRATRHRNNLNMWPSRRNNPVQLWT